jgi:hypothetical protein
LKVYYDGLSLTEWVAQFQVKYFSQRCKDAKNTKRRSRHLLQFTQGRQYNCRPNNDLRYLISGQPQVFV